MKFTFVGGPADGAETDIEEPVDYFIMEDDTGPVAMYEYVGDCVYRYVR